MVVHNTIAGGIGKGFKRKTSIPQGCPLSKLFMALLMRPWAIMIWQMGHMQTRILADDIMLSTRGKGMCRRFARGPNTTHLYLKDMGARVAPRQVIQLCHRSQSKSMA